MAFDNTTANKLRKAAESIRTTNILSLGDAQLMLNAMADIIDNSLERNVAEYDVHVFPAYEEDWADDDILACLKRIKEGKIPFKDIGTYGRYIHNEAYLPTKYVIELFAEEVEIESDKHPNFVEKKIKRIVYDIRNQKAYSYLDDI